MVSDQEARPDIGHGAKDLDTGKIGFVMGWAGERVMLRPLAGGREWEAKPDQLVAPRAGEELSARLSVRNDGARWHA